jgi:hypothetical protein
MQWMQMSESQARFIDSMCKILTLVGLVGAGIWAIVTYKAHNREVTQALQKEAWKPYRSARFDLYTDVMDNVAHIMNDPKGADKYVLQLSVLYQGKGRLFAEKEVQQAWTEFDECRVGKIDGCPSKLSSYAVALGAKCRQSFADEWDIYIPEDQITLNRLEKLRD